MKKHNYTDQNFESLKERLVHLKKSFFILKKSTGNFKDKDSKELINKHKDKYENYESYLIECLERVFEDALEVKESVKNSNDKKSDDYIFQSGRSLAYTEIIVFILEQARFFGIRKELGKGKYIGKLIKDFNSSFGSEKIFGK